MNAPRTASPTAFSHPESIATWTTRHARERPEATAFSIGEAAISWQHFHDRVASRIDELAALRVGPGEVVAYTGANSLELLELFAASAAIGAIFAPLNTRWSQEERRRVIDALKPRIVRECPEIYEVFAAPHIASAPRERAADLILHTSGSTGVSRGVVLTRQNLEVNAIQFARVTPLRDSDVGWAVAPFFHAAGLNVITTPLWRLGGTSIIDACFDAERGASLFQRGLATCTFLVPQMWSELFDALGDDPGTLTWGVVGGAPCPEAVFERARTLGVRLFHGYGMTETSPMGTMAPPERATTACVGRPGPWMELEVRNGEVFMRGPNVSPGYWRNPAASSQRFRDGWVATGDVGFLAENGDLHLRGRVSDMIITGGENVFPAEVESALRDHPDIFAASVFGIPSKRWGETVVAAYAGPRELDEGTLRAWAVARLGTYKAPRRFVWCDALPRLGSGKPDIERLRQMPAIREDS